MATKEIVIPNFDHSGFYYPEILRSLIQFQRVNVPEITDESDEEPFQQLLRAFALVGHLNNVNLDIVANEGFMATSRLLESLREHLKLIDVQLRQATAAQADVVLELTKIFTIPTLLVPGNSQFGTEETDEAPQITFEREDDITIQPGDKPTAIYTFTAGKIKVLNNAFNAGDKVTIAGVDFGFGVEWVAGGTIALTIANIVAAINASTNDAIKGKIAAQHDGVDLISVVPIDPSIESITIAEVDGATNNFEVASGGFGVNNAGVASVDAVFFSPFTATPKAGDVIYVGHQDLMWNTLEFVFNTFAAGLTLVLEFFDNDFEDAKPDLVTNLGSNLKFDLTTLLGTSDRSGTVVRVVLSSTGSFETLVSKFVGGVNIIETAGLLGQVTVSTNEEDYIVGSLWNEVKNLVDGSTAMTADGKMVFDLPQTVSENWVKSTINGQSGHWLRLRVVKVTAPVGPSVDAIRIDTGKQYLLVPVVQGQTVVDDPLGSSNGAADQEFVLTYKPLIEGTLIIEVDEGAGFQEWSIKKNFLNSSSVSKDCTLEIDANDLATVKFGDGTRGKIPNAGVDNIRAIYRVGADTNGNVGANTIKINKSGISFVGRIFNPRQATGWSAKEGSTEADRARLKVEGPASIRTNNRGITGPDIEFLATQFVSSVTGSKLVSRAFTIEETFGVKTVELIVVGTSGILLTEAQRDEITDYFNGNKSLGIDPVILSNHEVTVVNYTPKVINVTATVTGGNAEEIKNAIASLLNPDAKFSDGVTPRWGFGDEVPFSVIIAEIFEVDPVNIKKVVLTSPAADTVLATRELPLAGTISITVI